MSLSTMAFNDEVGNDEVGNDYQTTPAPDWTTVQAILGSFRPADAASWASYLASAPFDEASPVAQPQDLDLLRTERIEDWLVGPEPGTPIPQREVAVIHSDPDDPSADSSAAITIESDVDFVTVAPGEPSTIVLTMSNHSGAAIEEGGCSFGTVTWSLIDEHGLVTPAGARDVFCDPSMSHWPDGEQRRQTFDFLGQGQPMPGEGPVAAVIDFGHTTVVVPGHVGL